MVVAVERPASVTPLAGWRSTPSLCKANEIQVRPGLTASVEIKAKERSVLSYLIKPLSKTLSMSMWEK